MRRRPIWEKTGADLDFFGGGGGGGGGGWGGFSKKI